MKNIFIQISALIFLFFTVQSNANPINKINFIGLNTSSESSLIEILPFKIGQDFSPYASDKIIQSLFETGLFSDIKILKNKNSLDITLTENPIIKFFNVNIAGPSGFSAWLKNDVDHLNIDEINALVNENELSAGNIYSDKSLEDFILLLESKYSGSGYYNLSISSNIAIDAQNRVTVEIKITQGNRASIDSFKIIGSNIFLEDELLDFFKIGEANLALINFFTNKNDYSDIEIAKGIDLMTNHYFDNGYLDFKIINVENTQDESKENISIIIEVSEGIQYKLGNISFNGELGNISTDDLENSITISNGDIFNRNLIIDNIQTITDLYADQGYAFVEVSPKTSDILNSVNISFFITLNKKVYVNRIMISGNTRTQDEVIRREIGISEGGLYSRSNLRRSILNLRRLGYFSDVIMESSKVEGVPDKINLSFIVKETQTGAVSFSVSHSNNYGISLGAGIQEKNIFGSGNTLNADLKISKSFNKVSFFFRNPNYNEKNHSISVGAFRSEIHNDDISKDSYEIDSTGLTLGYGIPLSEDTRINTGLEYSKNDIKCSSLFSSSGYESNECQTSSKDELKFNISWSENTLNDYLYPTKGENNSLAMGVSLPLGDYKYFDINAAHTSYSPINDNVTMKLAGSLNLAKGYGNKELPFYKRYFGGGSGSVRGFGNKTLGPLYPNGKAKGGEISLLGSVNLIAPAFFFDNNDKMRMSAFIDAGNIYEKTSNIKLGDIRVSAGFGFAYLSPIGSIGAFVSTPILKKDGDIIEDFGFSLGTGF